jgi:hypothetical protein
VRIIYPEYEKGKEELLKMVREELTKKKEKKRRVASTVCGWRS